MSNGAPPAPPETSDPTPPAAPPARETGSPTPIARLFFVALTFLLVIGILEIGSTFVLSLVEGKWTLPSDLRLARLGILAEGDAEELAQSDSIEEMPTYELFTWRGRQVIHPFVGYVNDAFRLPFYRPKEFDETSRELGFPFNRHALPRHASPDRWVVGIFGGSFAEQTHRYSGQVLEEALEASPRFAGRDVVVLGFAAGGYKQPQQLMTASYLLSIGIHLDSVINLDGFNEINLPVTENIHQGVSPFFPRGWKLRVEGMTPQLRQLMGEVAWLGRLRRRAASFVDQGPWTHSPTFNLIWRQVDLVFQARIGAKELELVASGEESDTEIQGYEDPTFPIGGKSGDGDVARSRNDFQASGPSIPVYADWLEIYSDLAAVWARSSRTLAGACESQGIEYHHFLQPNQYVEGSKPWSSEEKARAYYREHPWRRGIELGYPLLRTAGQELRADGIRFHDLIPIFRDQEQTLYADACCHLNKEGYDRTARRIAEIIAAAGD